MNKINGKSAINVKLNLNRNLLSKNEDIVIENDTDDEVVEQDRPKWKDLSKKEKKKIKRAVRKCKQISKWSLIGLGALLAVIIVVSSV